MIFKTHAYGTTRKGVVEHLINARDGWIQIVLDDVGEAHFLMAGCGDRSAKSGDKGTLTFTKGGPTGGYWKFNKD